MRSKLSNLFLAAAVAATVALAIPSAQAETVTVPFGFNAEGMTFPAGEYRVNQNLGKGMVTLQSMDGSKSLTSVVGPGDPAPCDSKVALYFDASPESHQLRSIQFHGLTTSRLDKESSKNRSQILHVTSGD